MRKVRDFFTEWGARRAGRRGLGRSDLSKSIREGVGPTGMAFSAGWKAASESPEKYAQSFDRRLPPSTHISERDRKRANRPIPVSERCIEDWPKK